MLVRLARAAPLTAFQSEQARSRDDRLGESQGKGGKIVYAQL
jgi:hypothetical protein